MLIRFLSTWIRDSRAARREAQADRLAASSGSTDRAKRKGLSPAGPLRLYREGARTEALQAAAQCLKGDPHDPEAHLVKSLFLLDTGHAPEAARMLEAALKHRPEDGELLTAAGRAHLAMSHYAKARQLLQLAVSHEPQLAQAQLLLGNACLAMADRSAAEAHYREALAADDDLADAHANLGAVLKDQGDTDGAALHLERALQLKPELAPASFNLAMLRVADDQWAGVAALLRDSLRHDPKQADAWYWLGNALMREGAAADAREAYSAAVGLDRKFVRARWGFAMAQLPAVPASEAEQGAAVPNFAREFKKVHGWINMHRSADAHQVVGAQQPYYLAYTAQDHSAVLREYGVFCSQLMAGWAGAPALAGPMTGRGAKRKVGIVSAHICSHSVWHALVRGWVEHLDSRDFEVHLWHTGHQVDAQTQWAGQRVQRLHHRVGDWTAWAKAIAGERFDVLVYPEIGMDATTLRLSALRLAPKQLAGWGHPITTGLPTIDGFLSAQAFEPAGAERHYTERLHVLPGLGCCYQPYGTRPGAIDLPAWGVRPGERLLVCAGTAFKYAPADDALWVKIAQRCAPCKLVFFRADPPALAELLEQRLRKAFQTAGADFDASVRFVPWQSQAAFFALLDQAHVLLDTIGFSGFNTAMQAVERGLPVVAWEGTFMRGRFASGILRSMGLDELVANTADDYVDKVVQVCLDPALRQRVRDQLAERRAALFNNLDSVAAFSEILQAAA
jgi:predicted O-linked N-acetylglucosamine transferase (SPINDLY family)